jgi:capsular polysaccharide export protein
VGPADPAQSFAGGAPRRLFCYNSGLLKPGRVRRILTLAGYAPTTGRPGPDDLIGVWGRSPYAARGEAMARKSGAPLLRIEDAFLRSLRPGRAGDAPLGLMVDPLGVHFDGRAPSRLEQILSTEAFDDHGLLTRARDGLARIAALKLSKYNTHDPDLAAPPPGYVLVVDQLRDDASVRHGGANAQTFREMLVRAQEDHPSARIVVKSHPETLLGLRPGHYGPDIATGRISLLTDPVAPQTLLEGAIAVYTATSQLGFEAILAGHRPHVFGTPFYAGWGLTEDEQVFPRRLRTLTKVQLFAAAMIVAPTWYDPCRDRLCPFEDALDQLEAEVRAWREDRHGYVATGIRLWKRGTVAAMFGKPGGIRFTDDPVRAARLARSSQRRVIGWAGKLPDDFPLPVGRIEDGFIRSRGLGAELVPPLSLVMDDLGIYYDPSRESRLDRVIAAGPPPGGEARAERLVARIVALGVTKYNLGDAPPGLPSGPRILVPGQVEDDASIILGAGEVRTNLALLERVRLENPGATILYKPHPDVVAGLRPGALTEAEVRRFADVLVGSGDVAALLHPQTEVWTMTSLTGFEALLRDCPVTCLGTPFYAGWGLTRDLAPVPPWRGRKVSLAALAHATLIAYPRYRDPVTGLPCPAEVVVDRLAAGTVGHPGAANRVLSKVQGLFASRASLWR